MKLSDLCTLTDWRLLRDAEVDSLGFIDIPLDRRLVFAIDRRNLAAAGRAAGVGAVVTSPDLAPVADGGIGLATVPDVARSFLNLHNRLTEEGDFYAPCFATRIDASAEIHAAAHVDSTGVIIGPGCRIGAGAVVLRGTTLGESVRILPGAVIGGEGFQSLRFNDTVLDFRHAGGVQVGDRTSVLANSVIARAVFRQSTSIGSDCRIGSGVFVSHNCAIGDRVLLGHGAVIAGNCRVGRNATIGPGAVIVDRLDVGEGSFVTAGAVVVRPVGPGKRVTGTFAGDHRRRLRAHAVLSGKA